MKKQNQKIRTGLSLEQIKFRKVADRIEADVNKFLDENQEIKAKVMAFMSTGNVNSNDVSPE